MKVIDSHSSGLNNKRVQMLLIETDQRALAAANTLHYESLKAYSTVLEQLYVNVKDVIIQEGLEADIDATRRKIYKATEMLTLDPRARNSRMLLHLSRILRKFNSQIITALQSFQYFFRLAERDTKGLMNIKFYEDVMEDDDEQIKERDEERTDMCLGASSSDIRDRDGD